MTTKTILFSCIFLLLFSFFVSAVTWNVDYKYANVNASDYWDNLNTPADILFSDLGCSSFNIYGCAGDITANSVTADSFSGTDFYGGTFYGDLSGNAATADVCDFAYYADEAGIAAGAYYADEAGISAWADSCGLADEAIFASYLDVGGGVKIESGTCGVEWCSYGRLDAYSFGVDDSFYLFLGSGDDAEINFNRTDLRIASNDVTLNDKLYFLNFDNYIFDSGINVTGEVKATDRLRFDDGRIDSDNTGMTFVVGDGSQDPFYIRSANGYKIMRGLYWSNIYSTGVGGSLMQLGDEGYSNFIFQEYGGQQLNTTWFNGKYNLFDGANTLTTAPPPTVALEVRQPEDDKGFMLRGYDDLINDTYEVYINSSGDSIVNSSYYYYKEVRNKTTPLDWYTGSSGGSSCGSANYARAFDPDTDEYTIWTGFMPEDYIEGGKVYVNVFHCLRTAQTDINTVRIYITDAYMNGTGISEDHAGWHYDSILYEDSAPQYTMGNYTYELQNSANLQAGDYVSIVLYRDANSASDNVTGDWAVTVSANLIYPSIEA